jgi:hypothetical protein
MLKIEADHRDVVSRIIDDEDQKLRLAGVSSRAIRPEWNVGSPEVASGSFIHRRLYAK